MAFLFSTGQVNMDMDDISFGRAGSPELPMRLGDCDPLVDRWGGGADWDSPYADSSAMRRGGTASELPV